MLERLGQDVIDASIHYQLHAELRKAIRSFTRELNESPAFWTLTLAAHYDAFRSRLFRAYDSHRASLSLSNILDAVAERLPDSPLRRKVLGRDRRLVSDRDPLVKQFLANVTTSLHIVTPTT